ncbi:hypothetical protein M0D45_00140 [Xanthomonas prunicola]|uniref:hypothetical protein n=1 Tax=Xanthomonas prunicola TaxID=2053930 RepID=UPI0021B318A4|nr:hypothetical protein [Xanthomonas prunicola]UXA53258.1 hypothetical protein M0D45_00140 [Xanthomonas prunicola]
MRRRVGTAIAVALWIERRLQQPTGNATAKDQHAERGLQLDGRRSDIGKNDDHQRPGEASYEKPTNKPSWAVIATEAKAFDQAMLMHMAKRIGADITTMPGSHALFITQSQTVSDVIDRAARSAATKAKSTSNTSKKAG